MGSRPAVGADDGSGIRLRDESMLRAAAIEESDREDLGLISCPRVSEEAAAAMPGNELLHAVMGVQT